MINVFPFFLFSTVCPNGITNITASKGVIAYPESGTYGINETKCWRIEVPEGYRGIYWTFSRQATLCCSFLHEPLLKHNGDILLDMGVKILNLPRQAPQIANYIDVYTWPASQYLDGG